MRNLQFERSWRIIRPAGDGVIVELISRAENDEGEFIVANHSRVVPGDETGVSAAKDWMLRQAMSDEKHINEGYGNPIEWPWQIRIKRYVRRLLNRFLPAFS